ncbi:glycosyl transferase family 2 [Streptomyces sp. 2333.5]|uniref:glycosyltransferase n=1 Tax=Streptomyces TaxID=1883 RepID=UPI000899DDA2|nr:MULTISPECIES: glycosyltransferase [unclassified Streptomyces]PJJ00699.1 glycosyl transferase family 2 [Streptomyces sp. 2333.5]SEC08055.1 Glycosyl transferase family 2 [Streptomyces sp. 2314.4]SEC97892.1 Glycosyl transferase family 2 [Streptomyces sp. 2112.2]
MTAAPGRQTGGRPARNQQTGGQPAPAREAQPARPLPLVSVVLPARNAAATLGRQLEALADQDYAGPWEVIVVDDGSQDGTGEAAAAYRHRLPRLVVVRARGTGGGGVNRARNTGCRHSQGDVLVFCDADDVVAPGWLTAMERALRRAPAAGGALERVSLNDPVALAARPPKPTAALADTFGFLPYPLGANCGARREVWAQLGGFDERYLYGSDDVEFFWRAQLAGRELAFVPDAVVHYQLRSTVRQMARQAFRYGRSHPMLFRTFAAHGMPRSSLPGLAREWGWLLCHGLHLVGRTDRRAAWLSRAALRSGRLVGSVRHRVLYL